MMNYKLLKFTNKRKARMILRKLNDCIISCSSLYRYNNSFYLLAVVSDFNLFDTNDWLSNFTSVEQLLFAWAKSEVDRSVDFIDYETKSHHVKNARELITPDGSLIQRTFTYLLDVLAIVNCTADSFSDGGRFNTVTTAREQVLYHLHNGVEIIDIGVESTRPGAIALNSHEELQRLKQFLAMLMELKQQYNFAISVDTYHAATVKWLVDQDIDFINDVSGNLDLDIVVACITNGKRYITMHSLDIPVNKNHILDLTLDPVLHLLNWVSNKIHKFQQYNINLDQVIFDPGLGFGNNAAQAWYVLSNIHNLNNSNAELLVGHSRKSLFTHITNVKPCERDLVTGMVAAMLATTKVDYLRLHDTMMLNEVYPVMNMLRWKQ